MYFKVTCKIVLVTSYYRNQGKSWPDGPLDCLIMIGADFTFFL